MSCQPPNQRPPPTTRTERQRLANRRECTRPCHAIGATFVVALKGAHGLFGLGAEDAIHD